MKIRYEITSLCIASYILALPFLMLFHFDGHNHDSQYLKDVFKDSIEKTETECQLCDLYLDQLLFWQVNEVNAFQKVLFQKKKYSKIPYISKVWEYVQLRGPPKAKNFF